MTLSKTAIQFSAKFLEGRGFELQPSFGQHGAKADIYGLKKGKQLGILPYGDYLFLYDFDHVTNPLETLTDIHQKARKYVNTQYRVPKALRLSVPNIATIAIASGGFDATTQEYVQKPTKSIVGGEVHSLFLIDLANKVVYSQGVSLTYIVGEARLVFGRRKEFKQIDPQNRAYYLMQDMAKPLFEFVK